MRSWPRSWRLLACCRPAAAASERAFNAFADGPGNVHISHDGQDHLNFNIMAWGTNWAYAGIEGQVKSEGAASVGKLGAKIGPADVRIGFRAESPQPDRLQLSYELQSDKDVGLTYIVVAVEPGAAFQGRQVKVQSQGRQTTVGYPFRRQGAGDRSRRPAVDRRPRANDRPALRSPLRDRSRRPRPRDRGQGQAFRSARSAG